MSKKPKIRTKDRGSVRFIKGLFRFIFLVILGAVALLVMMNLDELGYLYGFSEKFNWFINWAGNYIKIAIEWLVPYIKIVIGWIKEAIEWIKGIF